MYNEQIRVAKIQKFSTHDGPGVRTTVFLKGCPLRCKWCHNPETQSPAPQLMYADKLCIGCGLCAGVCPVSAHRFDGGGHQVEFDRCEGCGACAKACPTQACEMASEDRTAEEILSVVRQDMAFYGQNGGLTLSGGEPMYHPEACLQLLRLAKQEGIGTALETSGFFDEKWLTELAAVTDCFLWDFKDSDNRRHLENTGVSNQRGLNNLKILDRYTVKIVLRCIMIAGVNLNKDHLDAIAKLYRELSHCVGVELLPYHTYGSSKSVQLGREEDAKRDWIPSEDALSKAIAYLTEQGVPCILS